MSSQSIDGLLKQEAGPIRRIIWLVAAY